MASGNGVSLEGENSEHRDRELGRRKFHLHNHEIDLLFVTS